MCTGKKKWLFEAKGSLDVSALVMWTVLLPLMIANRSFMPLFFGDQHPQPQCMWLLYQYSTFLCYWTLKVQLMHWAGAWTEFWTTVTRWGDVLSTVITVMLSEYLLMDKWETQGNQNFPVGTEAFVQAHCIMNLFYCTKNKRQQFLVMGEIETCWDNGLVSSSVWIKFQCKCCWYI